MTIPEIRIQDTINLPVLGIGTWEMGGRSTPDTSEDKKWLHALEFALQSGITHIDTAAIYGGGHAEKLVGEAIKPFKRNELLITTKVSGNQLQFEDVLRSAKASLKRLNTDYIDLFLLHWPNASVPLSQTMSAINKLMDDAIIRHFGVSNFPVQLMQEIKFYTDAPIITNQIEYNLFTRNSGAHNQAMETEIIPYCQKNGISITAWRPMMKGHDHAPTHPLLLALAEKYGKTPFQIGLNWLVNKPLMLAIPKMSSEEHILQNIEALQFQMEAEDLEALQAIDTSK